jgi:hypothetical protein
MFHYLQPPPPHACADDVEVVSDFSCVGASSEIIAAAAILGTVRDAQLFAESARAPGGCG